MRDKIAYSSSDTSDRADLESGIIPKNYGLSICTDYWL